MTLLHEAVEAKKFDVRMIERNTARNVISAEEVAKISKGLPDDGDAADWISIDSLAADQAGQSSSNQD
jgi:hypothetical protein